MPVLMNVTLGEPHKEGEPEVCTRCKAPVTWPFDTMSDEHGNRWLFCEACSVAMISGAEIVTDH